MDAEGHHRQSVRPPIRELHLGSVHPEPDNHSPVPLLNELDDVDPEETNKEIREILRELPRELTRGLSTSNWWPSSAPLGPEPAHTNMYIPTHSEIGTTTGTSNSSGAGAG
eukprot:CAMPEP_0197852180 /NCGR_PEP_ID=MMETSP1438-20131217/19842_1 /TAXON_ID=1461541 /ORGANISM="Pterosperma sp., Strain CCMP1384" /LENGTH=110 /DNA_ID=CAMNT_0043466075 /DNA_START=96 /DNA_END=425 /DNA_ORIENTATION=-